MLNRFVINREVLRTNLLTVVLAPTTLAIVVCGGQEIGTILPTPTLVPGDRTKSNLEPAGRPHHPNRD